MPLCVVEPDMSNNPNRPNSRSVRTFGGFDNPQEAMDAFAQKLYDYWMEGRNSNPDYNRDLGNNVSLITPENIKRFFERGGGVVWAEFPGGVTYALVDLMTDELTQCCGNCAHYNEGTNVCGRTSRGEVLYKMFPYRDVRSNLKWRPTNSTQMSKLEMQFCTGFTQHPNGKRYKATDRPGQSGGWTSMSSSISGIMGSVTISGATVMPQGWAPDGWERMTR